MAATADLHIHVWITAYKRIRAEANFRMRTCRFVFSCNCQGGSVSTFDRGFVKGGVIWSVIARGVAGYTYLTVGEPICQRPIEGTNASESVFVQVNNLKLHLERDDCASNPCQNGGTCEDVGFIYECTCVESYTGADCEIGEIIIISSVQAHDQNNVFQT
jgi:hypothetical protein